MNIHDFIAVIAAVIVVAGWFVNSWLNRRHEMATKRIEYHLDALHSFVPIFFAMKENRWNEPELKLQEELAKVRVKFQLYCHKDEIEAFERLVTAIEIKSDDAYTNALRDLARLMREGVRNELGLAKYSPDSKPTPVSQARQ